MQDCLVISFGLLSTDGWTDRQMDHYRLIIVKMKSSKVQKKLNFLMVRPSPQWNYWFHYSAVSHCEQSQPLDFLMWATNNKKYILLFQTFMWAYYYQNEGLFYIWNKTVNLEIFARVLFSRNYAYAKFHENKTLTYAKFLENKTLAKWQNQSVVYWYR